MGFRFMLFELILPEPVITVLFLVLSLYAEFIFHIMRKIIIMWKIPCFPPYVFLEYWL